ncbi:MAG: molecular chaperone DnaJ [Actinomycetia bacterium]|nr:molecular chaperone DnaJ [Actinomycetes bacterium]
MASRFPSEWRSVDYYAELGVAADASTGDVTRRYRSLAKQLHPDVRPDDPAAPARFARVSSAHEVLGDPARRRDYDVYRRALLGDAARTAEARFRAPAGSTTRTAGASDLAPERPPPPPVRATGGLFGFFGEFASHHPFALGTAGLMLVILIFTGLAGVGDGSKAVACQEPTTITFAGQNTVYTVVPGTVQEKDVGTSMTWVQFQLPSGESVTKWVPDPNASSRTKGDAVRVEVDPQEQPQGLAATCPAGTRSPAPTSATVPNS